MPADEASQTSCYVLVDGRKVMEMQDADAAPRDWEWLRRRPREKSDMVERTTACPRQTKCLIAVEAGQYFEIYVGNSRSDDISTRVYVDGALVSKKMIDRPSTPTGKACCGISSSSYDDNARRTGYKQKMRFAPIAARDPGGAGPRRLWRRAAAVATRAHRRCCIPPTRSAPPKAGHDLETGRFHDHGRRGRWRQEKCLWHGRGI